jgi:hypothetical protein
MFDTKEVEIIKYGLANGKSQKEVQQAIANYRLKVTPTTTVAPKEQTFLQDAGSDIKQIGTDIKTSLSEGQTKINSAMDRAIAGKQGPLTTTYQQIGSGLGTVSSIFGNVIKGAIKAVLPQKAETALKTGLQVATKPILENEITKGIISKYNSLDPTTKGTIDAALGLGSFAIDVATLGAGKKAGEVAIKQGTELGAKVTQAGEDLFMSARPATAKIVEKLATPKPTPMEAVGEVLQGGTKDIKAGVKGLSAIDTTGVKTYQELNTKLTQEIVNLAQKVDKDLATDTTKKLLKGLTVSGKTASGTVVKYNPVERALTQLQELYTKIGDSVAAKNIKETLSIAKKQGLTNLEINDIARVYGQEFGSKAFSKMGDPLTSVNAQLYENTRKAVKQVARSGIKGSEAKLADETMSNLYRVNDLVKKNVEAVNKLQQKIKERGLFEKISYGAIKGLDVISGGTIRGIIGGLLPRGVGYKVMNALDIEKALESNLKIIQQAINSGSDAEIIKILGQLK